MGETDLIKQLFLEALGKSLRGECVRWDMDMPNEQWAQLFQLAQEHHVLPMIFAATDRKARGHVWLFLK